MDVKPEPYEPVMFSQQETNGREWVMCMKDSDTSSAPEPMSTEQDARQWLDTAKSTATGMCASVSQMQALVSALDAARAALTAAEQRAQAAERERDKALDALQDIRWIRMSLSDQYEYGRTHADDMTVSLAAACAEVQALRGFLTWAWPTLAYHVDSMSTDDGLKLEQVRQMLALDKAAPSEAQEGDADER